MSQFFRILVYGYAPTVRRLTFEQGTPAEKQAFLWSDLREEYLTGFRSQFSLEEVVKGADTEYDELRQVSRWVRGRWAHDGSNIPRRDDPISILEEAAEGGGFRCVEYSIVLACALTSLGIPARVVGLLANDVDTEPGGASHVVAEAYLPKLKRWIMVDGQFDATPVFSDAPLSALELQRVLSEHPSGLGVDSSTPLRADQYLSWISRYLFFFQVLLDNRFGVSRRPGSLILVPAGVAGPRVFQQRELIKDVTYTHSPATFYSAPDSLAWQPVVTDALPSPAGSG